MAIAALSWNIGLVVTERWNHNIHRGRQLIRLVPMGARDALTSAVARVGGSAS